MHIMKYDVFISYSRRDSVIVCEFVKHIIDAGYSVWMDIDGIESGDEFKDKIVSAIEESKVFLFFSSAASNASPWTVKEVNVAVALKKNIIPIKLDESVYNKSILFDLAGFDFVMCDADTDVSDVVQKLMHSLEKKIGKGDAASGNKSGHAAVKTNTPKKSGRTLKYIVVFFVLLLIVVICPVLLFLALAILGFVLLLVVICFFMFGGNQGHVENIKEHIVVQSENIRQNDPMIHTLEKAVDTLLSSVSSKQGGASTEENRGEEPDTDYTYPATAHPNE